MATLPLEGIRVLGMTVILAGPYAEMFLADYGAEVIRVESIQNFPPFTRGMVVHPRKGAPGYPNGDPGERPWNRHATFNSMARNKLGMTVDITKPEGMDVFKQLVRTSDVFISNYVPSALDKLGVTYEMLKKEKPDIIYAKITGYGDTGPYRNYRAQANGIDAIGGQASTRGYRDTGPSELPGASAADPAEGIAAVFAIVSALNYRDRTGKGQLIDMALFENFMTYNPEPFMDYAMNGRVQRTLGNRDPVAVPSGNFRCLGEDNWVSISVFDEKQWEGFCKVVGEAWVRDPRFKDVLNRRKHEDELEKLIESWTKNHDYYEVMHLLQKVGVPAGPVLTEAAVFKDPQFKARGTFVEVSQEETGTYLYPGALAQLKNAPLAIRHAPVRLGENNDYIYKEVLGIGDGEYQKLVKAGHIGLDYADGVG
ncbi:MAG: CoA transferase [Chloroflexi bacterium]|nr:CoA transferase [Chloroflexota bacterium]